MPTDGILTFRLKVAETVPAVAVTCATPAMEPRVANAEASPVAVGGADHIAQRDGAGRDYLPSDGGALLQCCHPSP